MEPRQTSGENLSLPQPTKREAVSVSSSEAVPTAHVEKLAGRNEQTERRLGQQVETMVQTPSVTPATTLPIPVSASSTSSPALSTASDDTPLIAADEDLIEKEWVDKAKKVIAETKDDPYLREQEVKKLQVEYVRKRYGREIGKSGNDDKL